MRGGFLFVFLCGLAESFLSEGDVVFEITECLGDGVECVLEWKSVGVLEC